MLKHTTYVFQVSDVAELAALFEQYNDFGECLLVDYWPERYTLDTVLLIENVWDGHGNIRKNLDVPDLFTFRCRNCRKAVLERKLAPIWREDDDTPWGMSEFAGLDFHVELDDIRLDVVWSRDDKFSFWCESLAVARVEADAIIRGRLPWKWPPVDEES